MSRRAVKCVGSLAGVVAVGVALIGPTGGQPPAEPGAQLAQRFATLDSYYDPEASQVAYHPRLEAFRVYRSRKGDRLWLEWGPRPQPVRIDPTTSRPFWESLLGPKAIARLNPGTKHQGFLETVSGFGQGGETPALRETAVGPTAFLLFQAKGSHGTAARVAAPTLPAGYDLAAFEDGALDEAVASLIDLVAEEVVQGGSLWIGFGKEGAAFSREGQYRIVPWRGGQFLRPPRPHATDRCGIPPWVLSLGGKPAPRDTVAALAGCSPAVWKDPQFGYRSDPDVWFFGD